MRDIDTTEPQPASILAPDRWAPGPSWPAGETLEWISGQQGDGPAFAQPERGVLNADRSQ